MRIASSPERSALAPRTAFQGSAAHSSFAQLLEGGAQARAVLSHRALSFAEAGIFGVHYGQGASPTPVQSAPAQPAAASERDAEAAERPTAQPADIIALAGSLPVAVEQGIGPAEGPVIGPPPGLPARDTAILAPSAPDCSAADGAATEGVIDEAHLAPARRPAPSPTRRRTPLHVRVWDDGAELVVTIEGMAPGDESISELEATARAVACEYCVGISRLFVKPGGNVKAT